MLILMRMLAVLLGGWSRRGRPLWAERRQPVMALLIDGENIGAEWAAAIVVKASLFGEVAIRRVYGDWASPQMSERQDGWVSESQLGQHLHKRAAQFKPKTYGFRSLRELLEQAHAEGLFEIQRSDGKQGYVRPLIKESQSCKNLSRAAGKTSM